MNLDQQIRAYLNDPHASVGRIGNPAQAAAVDRLADAIRAVLRWHADDRQLCVSCARPWPCPTVKAIAAHLGITEKQDETDTGLCPAEFAGEQAGTRYACTEVAGHPGTHKATSVGGRTVLAEWTDDCTCDYGTPVITPDCPVHQQPAGLTIDDPIELTPEQFAELRQAWLDRNPELPAGAPPLARYARMIDRLTMRVGPVICRNQVINGDEEAGQ